MEADGKEYNGVVFFTCATCELENPRELGELMELWVRSGWGSVVCPG